MDVSTWHLVVEELRLLEVGGGVVDPDLSGGQAGQDAGVAFEALLHVRRHRKSWDRFLKYFRRKKWRKKLAISTQIPAINTYNIIIVTMAIFKKTESPLYRINTKSCYL
jgi:hypothetical protein